MVYDVTTITEEECSRLAFTLSYCIHANTMKFVQSTISRGGKVSAFDESTWELVEIWDMVEEVEYDHTLLDIIEIYPGEEDAQLLNDIA